MVAKGTMRGGRIELDEPLPYDEGTRVEVIISADTNPPKGSPEAILKLAGTLTDEEADLIMKGAMEARRIDEELWRDP